MLCKKRTRIKEIGFQKVLALLRNSKNTKWICHISPTLNIQTKWIYSAIYSVTRFEVEPESLEGMDHITSSQLLLQRLLKYNSAASTLTTCHIYVLSLHQCRNTLLQR